MTNHWHKSLNLVASAIVVLGMLAFSAAAVSAHSAHSKAKATAILRYSDWEFPATLNPLQNGTVTGDEEIGLTAPDGYSMYFGLHNKLLPGFLVKTPTVKNGLITNHGLTIKMQLRPGLRWSNGEPIINKDMLFAWKIESDPVTGPYCAGSCDNIKSMSMVGKYGIVWHMKDIFGPGPAFANPGFFPVGWSVFHHNAHTAAKLLVPDAKFNYENKSYVTAGPYQVSQFVNNDRIVLTPMKYYKYPGGHYFSQMIFAFYSDKNSMIAAAAAKQTDVTQDYKLADIKTLQSHSNVFKTQSVPSYSFEHMEYNVLDKTVGGAANPLVNLKVRQALTLALDRVGLIESALNAPRKVAVDYVSYDAPEVVTPTIASPFGDKAIRGSWDPIRKAYVPYGPTAVADAKTLLKEAGYSHGFSISVSTTTGNPTRVAEFSVMEANWHQLGVTASLKTYSVPALFGSWAQNGVIDHGNFEVGLWGYGGVGPEYDGWKYNLVSSYIDRLDSTKSAINSNDSGIRNHTIDHDFAVEAHTLNPKIRGSAFKSIQVQVVKNAYWVMLFVNPNTVTYDNKVKGINFAPAQAAAQWNGYDWKPGAQ